GAILSSPKTNTIKNLESLGEDLGLIYQIKDDELGLFEDEKTTGKPKGSDIRENKKTLLRFYLFKNASDNLSSLLKKSFGNSNITKEEVDALQISIKKSGILKNTEDVINSYHANAVEQIEKLKISGKNKNILLDLAE